MYTQTENKAFSCSGRTADGALCEEGTPETTRNLSSHLGCDDIDRIILTCIFQTINFYGNT